ncbi:MAG: NADPH-dependent F420 reductase [Bdellovibrionia bacterium]
MKIGIIGSGKIGATLGRIWAETGHEIYFSSRHPSQLTHLVQEIQVRGHCAQAGTVKEAVRYGDVILFSPPYWETDHALELMGPDKESLDGKVVMDATNPFTPDGVELALPLGTTASSELVKKIPRARLVKAFNTLYWQTLQDTHHEPFENRYVICYVGNEESSKEIVCKLIEDAGFVSFDLGPLQNAVLMEPGGPFFNQEYTLYQAETVLRLVKREERERNKAA